MVRAASSANASPSANSVSYASRVRSASPSRRALAIDMRHIASLLRDPQPVAAAPPTPAPLAGHGDASVNTSICSSPHTAAWEPGDRGSAPVRLARSPAAMPRGQAGLHHQFSAVAEKVNVVIATLQRQCDADRRRLAQLERKVEARLEDKVREGESRVNFAELQGSVNGLIEETQGLTRRLESLDERIWARTSGSELTKQRNREIEQQVQAFEQQTRMFSAATEETQKRQATKIRRVEHAMEELTRRVAKAEEDSRMRPAAISHQHDAYLEARIGHVEQQQEQFDNEIRALQIQFEDGLHGLREAAHARDDSAIEAETTVEDAIQHAERGLVNLEKKLCGDVEEIRTSLASIKVRVDGQLQRVTTLAERMETAHEPAIDSLRAEFVQAKLQDRRELDSEVANLRSRVQEAMESSEETAVELREAMRQARAELAALSLRPEEAPALRSFEDRLIAQERDVCELRACLEQIPLPHSQHPEELPPDEVEDDEETRPITMGEAQELRRRMEWLEEQNATDAATEKTEHVQVTKVQNTVCELVEQVSALSHKASSADVKANALEQQVQQVQTLMERRQSETTPARGLAEVEAKIGAVSQQVGALSARLLEVEGGLDFARESGDAIEPKRGGGESDSMAQAGSSTTAGLQDKLEAVAEHLEIVDDLVERMTELERRNSANVGAGTPGGGLPIPPSPQQGSEISFGGDAPIKASSLQALEALPHDLSELREKLSADAARILNAEDQAKQFKADLSKQELANQKLEKELKDIKGDLGGRLEQELQQAQQWKTWWSKSAYEEVKESVAELRTKVQVEIEESMDDLRGQLESFQERAASKVEEPSSFTNEGKIEELEEMFQRRLRELGSKMEASESAISDVKKTLQQQETRADVAPAAAAVDTSALRKDFDEHVRKVDGQLEAVLKRASASSDEASKLHTRFDAVNARCEELGNNLNDLKGRQEQLTKKAAEPSKDETSEELKTLRERVDEVGSHYEEFSKGLQDVMGRQDELAKNVAQVEAKPSQGVAHVQTDAFSKRLDNLEEQVKTREQREDTTKTQVQERVDELTAQVSQELKSLVEHQRELVDTKASLESLTEKFNEFGAKGSRDEKPLLDSRVDEVKADVGRAKATLESQANELKQTHKTLQEMRQRLQAAEDSAGAVKKDLESLQGPKKVGISPGGGTNSPLAAVHDRLEELAGQVADLREKVKSGGRTGNLASTANDCEDSINFSLTEAQTERLGGSLRQAGPGDDSLNFSLTGSKQDLSLSELRGSKGTQSNASAKAGGFGLRDSGVSAGFDEAAAAESSNGSAVSSPAASPSGSDAGSRGVDLKATSKDPLRSGDQRSGLGGLPALGTGSRKSPVGVGGIGDDVDDVLDSLMGGGSKAATTSSKGLKSNQNDDDVLDSLLSGASTGGTKSLGGRPRPSPLGFGEEEGNTSAGVGGRGALAPVEEESGLSDTGDQSLGSGSIGIGAGSKKNPVAKVISPAGPLDHASPGGSVGLEASLQSHSGLEVSMSCQDISVAPDYSVEDSLELEKCDHVEMVQPSSPEPRPRELAKALPATDRSAEEGKERPGTTAASASTTGMSGAAAASAVTSTVTGISGSAAPLASSPKSHSAKEEDDDYGHESFEDDDMSVPESIMEGSDGDGSNNWDGNGSTEDV